MNSLARLMRFVRNLRWLHDWHIWETAERTSDPEIRWSRETGKLVFWKRN